MIVAAVTTVSISPSSAGQIQSGENVGNGRVCFIVKRRMAVANDRITHVRQHSHVWTLPLISLISDRFDSNSLVASLTPSFMTSMASQRSKEKEPKKTELSTMVQQITTSLANQVEKEAEQQQCNNNNASSSSSDGSNGRRRPAIQCHKCTHCAAPDCAK